MAHEGHPRVIPHYSYPLMAFGAQQSQSQGGSAQALHLPTGVMAKYAHGSRAAPHRYDAELGAEVSPAVQSPVIHH